jgi:hypothetical protein
VKSVGVTVGVNVSGVGVDESVCAVAETVNVGSTELVVVIVTVVVGSTELVVVIVTVVVGTYVVVPVVVGSYVVCGVSCEGVGDGPKE